MKNIQECFTGVRSISDVMYESMSVNEGLKDWFKVVKNKFKAAFEYLKGIVAKLGVYFLPVDKNGDVMPAISPLTAGQAYKDGYIKKNSTFVHLDKQGGKIVGLSNKIEDALKLHGKVDPIKYWTQLCNESDENPEFATIVENYMEKFVKENPDMINEVKLHNDDPEAKYNIIVDNNELKTEIKMHIRSRELAPLLIWGAPGIGKSAVLLNVLNEMKNDFPNYSLIVKTLSNETPDNFTLPTYVETEGGKKADDVPKTWLPVFKPTGDAAKDKVLDEACGNGLLFIDELSRATSQVLNVILPLVNERLFNGYKVGSGWAIVCASNRANDETDGQSSIGNALANRFLQLYYEPTVHTWREWADKQNFISPLLLQWLSLPESENMSGGKYFYMDPNEDIDDGDETKVMCTPRSWTNAMRSLAVYQATLEGKEDGSTADLSGFNICNIPTRVIQRQLNKAIPAQAIDSFISFLDVISKIGDFDSAVYEVWNNEGKKFKINKKDLNKITLPVAQLICTAHNKSLPTTEEFTSMAKWLVAQDSDQLASYVLDVFKNTFVKVGQAKSISSNNANGFFIAKERIKRMNAAGKKNEAKLIENIYKPILDFWGIDVTEIPDYLPGQQIIAKKYGESFKSAVVGDWADALG